MARTINEAAFPRPPGAVTLQLQRMAAGDETAREELLELLYEDLRRSAAGQMARERSDHTLQPTALVHEAWLRLARQGGAGLESRGQFLGLAALAMKRILIEHARRRLREKRGGAWKRVELLPEFDAADDVDSESFSAHLLALADGLEGLRQQSPRLADVVELRFFGGLTREDVAEVLGISRNTVGREWQVARAWLASRLDLAPGA